MSSVDLLGLMARAFAASGDVSNTADSDVLGTMMVPLLCLACSPGRVGAGAWIVVGSDECRVSSCSENDEALEVSDRAGAVADASALSYEEFMVECGKDEKLGANFRPCRFCSSLGHRFAFMQGRAGVPAIPADFHSDWQS